MITNLSFPDAYQSIQDDLWTVAESDNSSKPDFKFVFDVYNASNQLIRVKLYPDVIDAQGYFNAGPIVRNEIVYDWFVPEVADSAAMVLDYTTGPSRIYLTYDIRAGEEYISGGVYVSGVYVSGGTLVTELNLDSGQSTAYNFSAPLFKRRQIGWDYIANGKFVTNRPRSANCKIDGKFIIPFKLVETTISSFYIRLYNENNVNYASWNQAHDTLPEAYVLGKYNQLDIGPDAINRFHNELYASNFITSTCKYYDVRVQNYSTEAIISETYTINIDCNPLYTPIDLYFMNQWGMFDTARFGLVSRLNQEIERKAFSKRDYTTGGSTGTGEYYIGSVYNESKINYGSKLNWNYKLTMDYPSDEEYQWLAELIDSPQIYAGIDDNYYPVTIKATNYEYSKHIFNNLKAFEIEIEMNQTRYGFRR